MGLLGERVPYEARTLRQAAWAGLTDSVPRAAQLSIHARVAGAGTEAWADPSLAQVWGPRFSAYVVAEVDAPVFTVGRMPDEPAARRRAEAMAVRLREFLGDRRLPYGEAGRGIGVNPNALRYGTTTGMVRIRWEGARQPLVWTVPRPVIEPREARLELARRFLHVVGPGTAAAFARWAGIRPPAARAAFELLQPELVAARTPIGEGWILASDEASFRAAPDRLPGEGLAGEENVARLLPSGDAYWLLWGADRELLVGDARRRTELWTSRVWPGAILLGGEIVGTWRRADANVSMEPWRRLAPGEIEVVEAEAHALPIAGLRAPIRARWES